MKNWFIHIWQEFYRIFLDDARWTWILEGLGNTLIITAGALVMGIIIGIIIAAVRSSYDKNYESLKLRGGAGYVILSIFNWICKVYLTVIRGIPMVVQLLLWYFVFLKYLNYSVPVAIIAFGVNSGAYVAEIFRSGIMSIDQGQFEAGRSLGFNYFQMMRFVVIPQAFKVVLPTLCSEFIVLIKETSIAGYVGIMDLTKAGDLIRGRTFEAFPPLLAVAVVYLALVMLLTWLVGKLERRLRKSER